MYDLFRSLSELGVIDNPRKRRWTKLRVAFDCLDRDSSQNLALPVKDGSVRLEASSGGSKPDTSPQFWLEPILATWAIKRKLQPGEPLRIRSGDSHFKLNGH